MDNPDITLEEVLEAIDLAHEGLSLLSMDGTYIWVSSTYAKKVGRDPDSMIGQPWTITVHPEFIDLVKSAWIEMCESGRGEAEVIGLRSDGSRFWKRVLMARAKRRGHFCIMEDISKRKKKQTDTEEALRQSQVLRDILDIKEHQEKIQDLTETLEGIVNESSG